jgi:hypothetical protein
MWPFSFRLDFDVGPKTHVVIFAALLTLVLTSGELGYLWSNSDITPPVTTPAWIQLLLKSWWSSTNILWHWSCWSLCHSWSSNLATGKFRCFLWLLAWLNCYSVSNRVKNTRLIKIVLNAILKLEIKTIWRCNLIFKPLWLLVPITSSLSEISTNSLFFKKMGPWLINYNFHRLVAFIQCFMYLSSHLLSAP